MDKTILGVQAVALGMAFICLGLLLLAVATIYITGIPTTAYNLEFKEDFCETQGFDQYEDDSCIKFNNGNATITELHCEGTPQFGFIIYDKMFEKLTKCRTVI